MRIAIASSSLLALPTLEALAASSHEVVAIITTPDAPKGRGRELAPSELASWAEKNDYLIFKYAPETIAEFLQSQKIELVVTLSFGKIIKSEVLTIPRYGWLNIHFSQLPRWRGAAPLQRALLAGDSITGITIFQLETGMDTGPVFHTTEYPIEPGATTQSLLHELSLSAGEEIVRVVDEIEHGAIPTAQSEIGVTRAEKIAPSEGVIQWGSPAVVITRQVAALSDGVGTSTIFRGAKLNLFGVSIKELVAVPADEYGAPRLTGEKNEKLVIACADALLEFEEVKPAGKAKMKSADFLRGARIDSKERFL